MQIIRNHARHTAAASTSVMRVSISRTIVCTFPRRPESERFMQLAFLAPNLISLCRWWYQSAFRVFDPRRCISLTRDPRLKLYYLIFCCNRRSYLRTPGEDSVVLKQCFISTRERRVVLRAHVNSPRSHAAVLFQTETLDFIPPELWSPNLPDLTDHNIWRVTQRRFTPPNNRCERTEAHTCGRMRKTGERRSWGCHSAVTLAFDGVCLEVNILNTNYVAEELKEYVIMVTFCTVLFVKR